MNSNNNFPNMAIDTSGITKIVFCEEGVAGTTRIRLDHDVILGIDTWNLGQLNELLVIVPEGSQNWSAPQTNLVAEITSISAENTEQFIRSFSTEAPNIQLNRSFRRLVLAENLSVQLSDLYALEALFIREFNPAMRTAIGQTANRSLPIVEDIYFKADTPNYEFSFDLISEAVLDIFSGAVPNLGFVDNQRTFASSTEESDTPAYPVPNALRRPTVPLNAILIDDYDIDNPFVNRAWFTVSADEKSLDIFALTELKNVDVFAAVIDGNESPRLHLRPTSELQDDLYIYQASTPWSGDSVRLEIHEKDVGESVPRSKRAEVIAKQSMAYVTARLQTVARIADFDRLIQADPTLGLDLNRCRLLFRGIAKRPDLEMECQRIYQSFLNPLRNETLFSTWERCQTTEILRKLLSIGIDNDLPELPELNEKRQWVELRRTKELVDSLNTQIQIEFESEFSLMEAQRLSSQTWVNFIKLRVPPLSKRRDLSVSEPRLLDWSGQSSPNALTWIQKDSATFTYQIAREFAEQTLNLQSLVLALANNEKRSEDGPESSSRSRSSRSHQGKPTRLNNFDLLINKLRIAQSSI